MISTVVQIMNKASVHVCVIVVDLKSYQKCLGHLAFAVEFDQPIVFPFVVFYDTLLL